MNLEKNEHKLNNIKLNQEINDSFEFARLAHANQKYGDEPYENHILEVRAVARRFGFSEDAYPDLHIGINLHDVIEDTGYSRNDLNMFSKRGVELAWRVTDEDGNDRKSKKLATYPKIVADEEAVILKLCDRIANVERMGKLAKYKAEQPSFREHLYKKEHNLTQDLWEHLELFLKTN